MDFNNYWTRSSAQISYPEPYRMVQSRMAEPRFPTNTLYSRGAVDFSNYYHQPPLTLPPNLGYSQQPQNLLSYYSADDGGCRYPAQSKWNEPQPGNLGESNKNDRAMHEAHKYSYQSPEQPSLKNERFTIQQSGNVQRYSNNLENKFKNGEKVSTSKKGVDSARITPGSDGPPPKVRRVNNPPMPMLPPPKIKTDSKRLNEKASQPKSQSASQKATVPSGPLLSKTRVMAGSIQQLLKWNLILHKTPPLYETAGQLTNPRAPMGKCIKEYAFGLRNLLEWHKDDWGSDSELLDCIIYAEPDTFTLPSPGTLVRVVGRFQPAGLFHCLKVRKATQDDLFYLKTKLGLPNQNKRTSYGYNISMNSDIHVLEELDVLYCAPIRANPVMIATGQDRL